MAIKRFTQFSRSSWFLQMTMLLSLTLTKSIYLHLPNTIIYIIPVLSSISSSRSLYSNDNDAMLVLRAMRQNKKMCWKRFKIEKANLSILVDEEWMEIKFKRGTKTWHFSWIFISSLYISTVYYLIMLSVETRDIPQVNKYVNSLSCSHLCILVSLNYFFI